MELSRADIKKLSLSQLTGYISQNINKIEVRRFASANKIGQAQARKELAECYACREFAKN